MSDNPHPLVIEAAYIPDSDERHADGLGDFVCPVCGKEVHDLDLERYDDNTPGNSIELCPGCREDFELDCDLRMESADTLSAKTFALLYEWALESKERRG